MFTPRAIGYVKSPYKQTSEIPKGLGAKHDAEGVLEILPEFELGRTDIDGFSHLYILWEFDRSDEFQLVANPPSDNRPHGVFATRSPLRPNPIALSVVEFVRRDGRSVHARRRHARPDAHPGHQVLPFQCSRSGWLAEAEARSKNAQ